jgi:hypothetical protein
MPGEPYETEGWGQPPAERHGKPMIVAIRPLGHEDEGWELILDSSLWGELVVNQQSMTPEFVIPFATWQDAETCFRLLADKLKQGGESRASGG